MDWKLTDSRTRDGLVLSLFRRGTEAKITVSRIDGQSNIAEFSADPVLRTILSVREGSADAAEIRTARAAIYGMLGPPTRGIRRKN